MKCFVHRLHVRLQAARVPERSGAVRACEVTPLFVHRLHMPLQAAARTKRSGTVRACEVAPFLAIRLRTFRG